MKNRSPIPPGVITLCVVFISLCMSLLAMLTFSGAKSELELARVSFENRKNIMEADYACRSRMEKAAEMLNGGEEISQAALETGALLEDNVLIFEQAVDDRRVIRAEMTAEADPRTLSYVILYTGDWSPDLSIDVWDGQ